MVCHIKDRGHNHDTGQSLFVPGRRVPATRRVRLGQNHPSVFTYLRSEGLNAGSLLYGWKGGDFCWGTAFACPKAP